MLPNDEMILLSVVNTRLRDRYGSLTELCDDLGEDEYALIKRLDKIGYRYSEEKNQFI